MNEAFNVGGRRMSRPSVAVQAPVGIFWSDDRRPESSGSLVLRTTPLAAAEEPGDGITLRGFTAFGADARYRQSARHVFNAGIAALGAFTWTENGRRCRSMPAVDGSCTEQADARREPITWAPQATLGLSESVPGAVSYED